MEDAAQRIARIREESRQKQQADIDAANAKKYNAQPVTSAPVVSKATNETKVYFARASHSRFVFSDNQEIIFAFGRVEIGPKEQPGIYQNPTNKDHPGNGKPRYKVYQGELDEILGRNPNIYVESAIPEPLEKPAQNALSEAEVALAERQLKAAGISGVATQQIDAPTVVSLDPNANSMDPELQSALFARSGAAQSTS